MPPISRRPLRMGVLGTAKIARQWIRDLQGCDAVQVVAVASRSDAAAQAFAQEYSLPRWHGSYEALLVDPDVDAVYIPLPNSLHATWAIAAARQGKHVLCEKPLALGKEEAEAMFAAARDNGVVLLEA